MTLLLTGAMAMVGEDPQGGAAALAKNNSMLVISGGEGYIDFRVGKYICQANLFVLLAFT